MVLLLVLAAQAGILRPEVRVVAGAALAAVLVAAGWLLNRRPGGRVGAIALAATGIATAYIDVIAVTTIYGWVSAPVGLVMAAIVAVAGLLLARRWDTEHLGLLVLVPLIGLAPVVADGFTPLLVGFMLALSAASVPVQLGRDWVAMHAARMAVSTLPLLVALAFGESTRCWRLRAGWRFARPGDRQRADPVAPHEERRGDVAAERGGNAARAGCVDGRRQERRGALAASSPRPSSESCSAGDRLPMVTAPVRAVFSALAAVSALVAVTVAFDGPVAGPVLLAMAVVVAVAAAAARSRVGAPSDSAPSAVSSTSPTLR